MQKKISLSLLPAEAAEEQSIRRAIAVHEGIPPNTLGGFRLLKKSIDARGKQVKFQLQLLAFIGEPVLEREKPSFPFREVSHSAQRVIIIGAGPAGLFAALRLLEAGIKPVILERGKDVRSRRRDLARLNKEGEVDPDSNYCFGEGGAGTYSDGKLYTRSHKRGDLNRILELFVHFGADENILVDAHPHIGTNKLPHIITAMRQCILDHGGEIHFNQRVTDFAEGNDQIRYAVTADGQEFAGDAFLLATGHSARDIFTLLHHKQWKIEAKPFALGVRVEHPQSLIDSGRYHCTLRDPHLPPAAYSWVEQVDGKGVFSFCMCPGGIIAPASTAPGELVVNGWSPSKRNNPFANSGIVVSVEEKDWQAYASHGPLAAMRFQQSVEERAFLSGGGHFVAPAQRLTDYVAGRLSASLPDCSYVPGIRPADLQSVLPGFIHERLKNAFIEVGKKMKGYLTGEALLVATESRTSSPVRIPRDPGTLAHPQISNLYPCGEGAGYAGGIVSAAMDGERVAAQIAQRWFHTY